jgi:hypothetical protein
MPLRHPLRPIVALLLHLTAVSLCTQTSFASPAPTSNTGYAEAQTLFRAHCANAGEHIVRTVDEVEGIFLLKLRSELNRDNQFALDDPYGRDLAGKGYIESFLRQTYEVVALGRQRWPALQKNAKPRSEVGYTFVEAIDPIDGIRYRYTGRIEQPGLTDPHYVKDYWRVAVEATPAKGRRPRYGVTFDDISTREDRVHWIAGSSLKVIDLDTDEVIAERIGYMMDPGQGSTGGGRAPWLMAAAMSCPAFLGPHAFSSQSGQTVRFVEKVLHPKRSDALAQP